MLLRQRLMEQMESRMQVEDEELRDLIDSLDPRELD